MSVHGLPIHTELRHQAQDTRLVSRADVRDVWWKGAESSISIDIALAGRKTEKTQIREHLGFRFPEIPHICRL